MMLVKEPSKFSALSFKAVQYLPASFRHYLRKLYNAGAAPQPSAADFDFSPAVKWPRGKKFCLCVSHDVDSEFGLRQMPSFAELDKSLGLRSAFYIVPTLSGLRLQENFLKKISSEGVEIAQHGFRHDLDLAVQGSSEVESAFKASAAFRKKFNAAGFRSVAFQQSAALLEAENKFFSYDSSFQAKRIARPPAPACRKAFPFSHNSLPVLPVTLPADGELLAFGLSPRQISSYWLKTAKILIAKGALVSIVTHPEKYFSAGSEMKQAFADFSKNLPLENAWVATPKEAAALASSSI